jgi:AraC family transcriptional regulator of adaptative response/methylated-DNA-[protein]-cysteine methyltransferase
MQQDTTAKNPDEAVATAARLIIEAVEAGAPAPTLSELARATHRSAEALASGDQVADALYGAGFGSTSRVYERHGDLLGMTPATYRRGAPGETIRYALADSSLGRLIVGLTERGVCLIAFGDDDAALLADARARFSRARFEPAAEKDSKLVSAVIALVDEPARGIGLSLDVRGTAFQQRVWQALTRIEPGATVTYGELAKQIGSPAAVRAVAQACGANPLAVAVPCHRVIGADGSLTGYRWGVERKRELLARERV